MSHCVSDEGYTSSSEVYAIVGDKMHKLPYLPELYSHDRNFFKGAKKDIEYIFFEGGRTKIIEKPAVDVYLKKLKRVFDGAEEIWSKNPEEFHGTAINELRNRYKTAIGLLEKADSMEFVEAVNRRHSSADWLKLTRPKFITEI